MDKVSLTDSVLIRLHKSHYYLVLLKVRNESDLYLLGGKGYFGLDLFNKNISS